MCLDRSGTLDIAYEYQGTSNSKVYLAQNGLQAEGCLEYGKTCTKNCWHCMCIGSILGFYN